MVRSIIDSFCKQAREHKAIKAFYYNKVYEHGSGKEKYPLFWLEDPVYGRNRDNIFQNMVNFSVLFLPEKGRDVADLQNMAFSVGLNILERMRQDDNAPFSILPDWTYLTLRNYYDDDACGCRFSVNFVQRNMQNLCLIEEQFEADKEFGTDMLLPEMKIGTANHCEIFANKFPEFNLKTRK